MLNTQAQGFEGAHMTESFSKELEKVGTADLVGKKIAYTDYAPNPKIIFTKKKMSESEGISYALLLIRDPHDLKLNKNSDIANLIVTTGGTIAIIYSEKTTQWELFFIQLPLQFKCPHGCRVFEFIN